MKIYVVSVNGWVRDRAFTSLRDACDESGIGYSSATHGKRVLVEGNEVRMITEVEVVRNRRRKGNKDLHGSV